VGNYLHAQDYMVYAHLQLGEDKQARAVIDDMLKENDFKATVTAAHYALSASPARYAIERADWAAASQLAVRTGPFNYATAISHFGRALGAAEAEFTVRLSLSGDTVDVALRLSRKPLHRRSWKLATGPGTLHPPLAAALARIGGQGPLDTALDPFCGDGTLAIETAHAFPGARIVAADLDPDRLGNARSNAARARVGTRTRFVLADAGRPVWADGEFDLVVTNPPWNRAVGAAGSLADTLEPFWRALPGALSPHSRICTVAEAELDVPSRLDRAGYTVALAQTIRLAGRVSHVILAAPGYAAEVRLPNALDRWRERAIRAAIVSDGGF